MHHAQTQGCLAYLHSNRLESRVFLLANFQDCKIVAAVNILILLNTGAYGAIFLRNEIKAVAKLPLTGADCFA